MNIHGISQNTKENIITLVFIGVLLIVVFWIRYKLGLGSDSKDSSESVVEGFVSQKRIKTTPDAIYDKFYAGIYDQLFLIEEKNQFELQELQGYFLSQYKNRERVAILDLGCGTGHHLKELSRSYQNTTGVDQSQAMINIARKNSPKSNLLCDDFTKRELFSANSFTHILSYYFTIYYVEDKTALAHTIRHWLRPGGIWAVHVVNRSKFDPLLERTSPFPAFSLQKYAEKGERLTKSRLHFNNFLYQGQFIMKEKTAIDRMEDDFVGGGAKKGEKPSKYDDIMEFKESFEFKKSNRDRRQQTHTLYMPRVKSIIKSIETSGLRYIGNSNLLSGGCEYQFILYFKKDRVKGEKDGKEGKEGNLNGGVNGRLNSSAGSVKMIRPGNDEISEHSLASFHKKN